VCPDTREAFTKKAVSILVILAVVDALSTMLWYYAGWALEGNPVMTAQLEAGPLHFLLVKLGVTSLLCTVIWRRARNWWSAAGSAVCVSWYTLILLFVHVPVYLQEMLIYG